MFVPRSLPLVVVLALAAGANSMAACTSGTTPVCDDAGSCLILPSEGPVDGGIVDAAAGGDGSPASDAGPVSDGSHVPAE